MFQHFGQRLKRDLKQIVDRRLESSMVASGSHLKVRASVPGFSFVCVADLVGVLVVWC